MITQLNADKVEALLHQEIICRIACNNTDLIYIVPISYAYDGSNIYCCTKEGTKLEVMRSNPHVCLEVDDVHDMANWKSVIAWGNFREIIEKPERDKAIKLLLGRKLPIRSSITTHLGSMWPFADELADVDGIVFKIELTKKSGMCEYPPLRGQYSK